MGSFYCMRCDKPGESHDGDSLPDPKDERQFIHKSCLTDEEVQEMDIEFYASDWFVAS